MQHSLIQAGFILLTVGSFTLLFLEIRKAVNKTEWSSSRKTKFNLSFLIGLIAWTLFVSIWSLGERMANFQNFPFNMMPILAVPLIAILVFTFSKVGREILTHIPTENIIKLQAFRFFVELLLWALYLENQAPIQMTFEGRNWDVLSGLSAPIIAFLLARGRLSKIGLIIWNIACLALLVNIVTIAILSMPTPLRTFMNEPSNTIVTQFPVSWLPGLLVPLAYGLHFMSLSQLSIKNK